MSGVAVAIYLACAIAVVIVSFVLLSLIVVTDNLKVRTKQFIAQNFFSLRYDYQQEWIKFSTLFATQSPQDLPGRVIQALANITASPQGILFEWEEQRGYVLKECWHTEFPTKEVVLEKGPFTDYIEKARRPIELALQNTLQRAIVTLPPVLQHFTWAWALVPLYDGDRLHAFVLLAQPSKSNFKFNQEAVASLSLAGRQAAFSLIQEQSKQALLIARQFERCNRWSAFVMHDLKNVLLQLKLMQANKLKNERNPAFIKSVFRTIEHTAKEIDRLILQMRTDEKTPHIAEVDIREILQQVIGASRHRQPVPRLEWQSITQDISIMGNAEQFKHVICHLVENAQQATPVNGEVIISVKLMNEWLTLAIEDTGCGMEPEFIHSKLFKPFMTTKEKGMGIGVYEAREYLLTIGGRLTVETAKNKGTIFKIEIPTHLFLHRNVA